MDKQIKIIDLATINVAELTDEERKAILSAAARIIRDRPPTEAQRAASARNATGSQSLQARQRMKEAWVKRRERIQQEKAQEGD